MMIGEKRSIGGEGLDVGAGGRVMGKGRVMRDYYKEGYCCDRFDLVSWR